MDNKQSSYELPKESNEETNTDTKESKSGTQNKLFLDANSGPAKFESNNSIIANNEASPGPRNESNEVQNQLSLSVEIHQHTPNVHKEPIPESKGPVKAVNNQPTSPELQNTSAQGITNQQPTTTASVTRVSDNVDTKKTSQLQHKENTVNTNTSSADSKDVGSAHSVSNKQPTAENTVNSGSQSKAKEIPFYVDVVGRIPYVKFLEMMVKVKEKWGAQNKVQFFSFFQTLQVPE